MWSSLHKIRNNIIVIKYFLKPTYDIEEILYKLYNFFSSKYNTIVVVFKSQKEKNKNKTFRIL